VVVVGAIDFLFAFLWVGQLFAIVFFNSNVLNGKLKSTQKV
jgi:hypothetical protein